MTRAQAIKKHCLDCAGESPKEATLCEITDCPLWPYRLGNSLESKAYKKRVGKWQFLEVSSSKTATLAGNDD
jgi:hypothetical protein